MVGLKDGNARMTDSALFGGSRDTAMETRAAGQAIATLVQNIFNFVLGQTFLSMLCRMVCSALL